MKHSIQFNHATAERRQGGEIGISRRRDRKPELVRQKLRERYEGRTPHSRSGEVPLLSLMCLSHGRPSLWTAPKGCCVNIA